MRSDCVNRLTLSKTGTGSKGRTTRSRTGVVPAKGTRIRQVVPGSELDGFLDDVNALRDMLVILYPFSNYDRDRIIRWAREKLHLLPIEMPR